MPDLARSRVVSPCAIRRCIVRGADCDDALLVGEGRSFAGFGWELGREGSELPGSGVPPFAASRHLGASDRAGGLLRVAVS